MGQEVAKYATVWNVFTDLPDSLFRQKHARIQFLLKMALSLKHIIEIRMTSQSRVNHAPKHLFRWKHAFLGFKLLYILCIYINVYIGCPKERHDFLTAHNL